MKCCKLPVVFKSSYVVGTAQFDIPMSFNDPMFVGMTEGTSSLNGSNFGGVISHQSVIGPADGNFSIGMNPGDIATYCRLQSREGFRVAAAGAPATQTIDHCYAECTPQAGDHTDCCQVGQEASQINLVIKNSHMHLTTQPQTTGGLFVADACFGTVTIKDSIFRGGANTIRIAADVNNIDIFFQNVYIVLEGGGDILFQRVAGTITIQQWDNVRHATIVNGVLVLGDQIPPQ